MEKLILKKDYEYHYVLPSKEVIDNFEQTIGAKLPNSLKELFLLYDGGSPNRNTFIDKEGFSRGLTFLGFEDAFSFHQEIVETYGVMTIIPFASNLVGGLLCIHIKSTNHIPILEVYTDGEAGELGFDYFCGIKNIKEFEEVHHNFDIFLDELVFTKEKDCYNVW